MKKKYVYCLMAVLSLLSLHCQKELSRDSFGRELPGSYRSGIVQGVILDENGDKAPGVSVQVGSKLAQTDENGFFRLVDAELGQETTVVTAIKNGYFLGIRSFKATKATNKVVIQLVRKTMSGVIKNEGGTVNLSNGSSITLSANSVTKAGGEPYTGDIRVFARYIDPSSPAIANELPGSFMAEDKSGRTVTLASYGMLAVELESSSGELLQIKKEHTAALKIRIPQDRVSSAPSSISLWSIDESTGIWKEEALANKQGSYYVGNVSHFSFWNADFPMPAVNLSFTLKTKTGNPLPGNYIVVRTLNGLAQAGGYTDSAGYISGLVPKDEKLFIVWYNKCYKPVDSVQVGPFSSNTDLGVITGLNQSILELSFVGKILDCNSKPVKNGTAIILMDGYKYYVGTDVNATFKLAMLSCDVPVGGVEVIGIDNDAKKQSAPVSANIVLPVTDLGNITACANSALAFITYTIDNQTYTITDSLNSYTVTTGRTPFPNQTNIFGVKDGNAHISFDFDHNAATGKYPLSNIYVNGTYSSKLNRPFDVEVTNYPFSFGQFWEGNFQGSFRDSADLNTKSISVTFRVRK